MLGQFGVQLENKAGYLCQETPPKAIRHIKNLYLKGKTYNSKDNFHEGISFFLNRSIVDLLSCVSRTSIAK